MKSNNIVLKDIVLPESRNPIEFRQEKSNDQIMLKMMQQAPEFIKCLEPCQTRQLQNIMVHNMLLKYFFLSIQRDQIDRLQKIQKQLSTDDKDNAYLSRVFSEYAFNHSKQKIKFDL